MTEAMEEYRKFKVSRLFVPVDCLIHDGIPIIWFAGILNIFFLSFSDCDITSLHRTSQHLHR